jgi:hypothetical protein
MRMHAGPMAWLVAHDGMVGIVRSIGSADRTPVGCITAYTSTVA